MDRKEAEEILKNLSSKPVVPMVICEAEGFLEGSDYERKRAEKLVEAAEAVLNDWDDETILPHGSMELLQKALSEWKKGE